MPSREVQAALQEQFDIYVSIGYLNRVRGQLGIENHRGRSKKNYNSKLNLNWTISSHGKEGCHPRCASRLALL